jgi:hypothetical protein
VKKHLFWLMAVNLKKSGSFSSNFVFRRLFCQKQEIHFCVEWFYLQLTAIICIRKVEVIHIRFINQSSDTACYARGSICKP